jgi:hypothetical protein
MLIWFRVFSLQLPMSTYDWMVCTDSCTGPVQCELSFFLLQASCDLD